MSKYYLMRAVVIGLGGDDHFPRMQGSLGDVDFWATEHVTQDSEPVGTVVVGRTVVDEPPVEDAVAMRAFVEEPRREVELVLESLGRLAAIDLRTSYHMSSPSVDVGVACDDDEGLTRLDGVAVAGSTGTALHLPAGPVGIFDDDLVGDLLDRLDGVALLAEALNHDAAIGRYGQLVRVFERAFAAANVALTTPLTDFLVGHTSHLFSAEEIAEWLESRGAAIHADRRPEILLESDLRPIVPRMTEAAYDVLFNKRDWHSNSVDRRSGWKAASGSSGVNGDLYGTQGRATAFGMQLLDSFGAYPVALMGPFDVVLPRAAWLLQNEEQRGSLKLRGDLPPWHTAVESDLGVCPESDVHDRGG